MLPSPCRERGHAGVDPLRALVGDGNPSTVQFGQPTVGHLPSSGLPGGLASDACDGGQPAGDVFRPSTVRIGHC
jgi:hypothetical protein